MVRTAPLIATLFFVGALSLAGIPPLSGFVSKFSLMTAITDDRRWWVLGVVVVVSLLTLFSMMKIWVGVFWRPVDDDGSADGAVTLSAGAAADDRRRPSCSSPARWRSACSAGRSTSSPSGPPPTSSILGPYLDAVFGPMNALGLGAVLLAIWLLLWGSVSVANVLSGIAVVLLIAWLVGLGRLRRGRPDDPPGRHLPLRRAVVVGMVRANAVLTREIVTPRVVDHHGRRRRSAAVCSDGLLTLIANVLALTPGTLPLEVDEQRRR